MSKANDLASLLADGTVGTAELDSGAVTLAKLADNAVDATKLKETDSYVIAGLDVSGGQIHDVASIYRGAISSTEAGIGLGSDGSVSFLYGTTEGARFSGEGRLGFGTQSPLGIIDIQDSVTPMIKMGYGGVNGEHKIGWDSTGMVISADGGATSSLSYISLQVFGNEALKIKSSGNVGLGIANPAHKLDVAGGIGIAGTEVITSTGQVVTAQLQDSGVAANTYGSAAQVPVITVDAKGRVTSASTTAVAGVSSTAYDSSTGVLTINTSDGGSFSEDLGIGTNDSPSFVTVTANLIGTASSANKWTTARTLSLTGAVTGSASMDGSGNVSIATAYTADPVITLTGDVTGSGTMTNLGSVNITTTVGDDSHTHNKLNDLNTISYGVSYFQHCDVSGTAGTGYAGSTPYNPTNDWYHHIISNHNNAGGYYADLAICFHTDDHYITRLTNGTRTTVKLWNSGNDGSGSGLDADLLDGLQASQFLRSDADDQTTNVLAIGSASGAINGEKLRVTDTGTFIASFQRTDGTPHLLFKGTGGISGHTGRFYMDNGAFQMSQGDATGAQSGNVWLHGLTNGNVGIGTSNPEAKLHVAGQILAGSGAGTNLVIDDGAESAKWGLATGSYNLRFQKNNGSGTYEDKITFTAAGGITTTGSVDINGSYLKLPTSTSAPLTPSAGYMYTNTNDGFTYVYDGSDWRPINSPPLGSTQATAADSAQQIYNAGDSIGNGFYWIYVNGTPTQVWCDMTNDGGGWMLVAHANGTDNNQWTYDSASWTNTTTFNETDDPTTTTNHIKTKVYTSVPFSQVRLCMGSISNGIVEPTWANATSFASFMNSGVSSSNSRTTWINWVSTARGQASHPWLGNCNQIGTNRAYNYQYIRIGATVNGENDCSSNDESFGFGSKGISPYSNNYSCGSFSPYNGYSSGLSDGWIFIK